MKKLLVLLLALVMCFSVFAAGSQEKPAAGKTELVFWHGSDVSDLERGLFEDCVAKYNATNDKNIHVTLSFVATQASGNTSTMSNLMATIAAGNPPDISLIDNFQVPTWAAQNALTPLDSYVASSGIDLSAMYDWAVESSHYKNNVYSIPYNADARAMVYNKDMFRAAGLDPDKPPMTIAEVTEVSKKLLVKDGKNIKQAGLVPWIYAGQPIYTWGWSFGGNFYDAEKNYLTVADEKIVKALQWEVDFANEMGGMDFVNFASGLGKGAEDPFVTGQAAMTIRGQFHIKDIERYAPNMDFGVTPIPSDVEGENTTWCGGWGWIIPRGAKHPEEAMDFIKFMCSDEIQSTMVETTGSLSPVKAVTEKEFEGKEKFKVFIDYLPKAHVRPAVPVGQKLWDDFNTVLDSALRGNGTPEELLKNLEVSINAELQKIK